MRIFVYRCGWSLAISEDFRGEGFERGASRVDLSIEGVRRTEAERKKDRHRLGMELGVREA